MDTINFQCKMLSYFIQTNKLIQMFNLTQDLKDDLYMQQLKSVLLRTLVTAIRKNYQSKLSLLIRSASQIC